MADVLVEWTTQQIVDVSPELGPLARWTVTAAGPESATVDTGPEIRSATLSVTAAGDYNGQVSGHRATGELVSVAPFTFSIAPPPVLIDAVVSATATPQASSPASAATRARATVRR